MNWIKNLQALTRLPKLIKPTPNHFLPTKHQNDTLFTRNIFRFTKSHCPSLCFTNCYYYNVNNSSSRFERAIHAGPDLSRDFLAQLWVEDDKIKKAREKRNQKSVDRAIKQKPFLDTQGLHGGSVTDDGAYDYRHVVTESVEYASPEEAWIAPLLSRSNLLITRDIEWANLTFGFEQENRYAIVDVSNPQVPAGYIREQSNVIARQLLRSRRPFVATVTDAYGNELFRVRRPFWWITSSIYAEVGGKVVGVVHRRWHLWRRRYDLYLGNEQFAEVDNPGFWYWTFTLKDINSEVLAEINRDWRGFGFEVFTDAGQYVIRFGSASANEGVSGLSREVEEFEVARPLTLLERAVTVALAVSLDNDYFSRHGGWGLPIIAVGE
ncbi:altered inheritance rate of mitochondria protein 25-like [Bidens hawaiensis]|uniref:altered inheritance rate of mitochondria protein 25-like n=1 Tax=Bidens hawaiensis TaxID=980011 RepID=UPI00404B3E7E